jgi:soluble P-type ATPase
MEVDIPGYGRLILKTLVLDLNGTIAVKGRLVEGVRARLNLLKEKGLRIIFFSGDTRGNASSIATDLGIEFIKAETAAEKAMQIGKLNPETCVAIGNGLIDTEKLNLAKLAIVTLQGEGVHTKALLAADILVTSINDALDLLLDENSLIATLRS